jgi:hypothetical protein
MARWHDWNIRTAAIRNRMILVFISNKLIGKNSNKYPAISFCPPSFFALTSFSYEGLSVKLQHTINEIYFFKINIPAPWPGCRINGYFLYLVFPSFILSASLSGKAGIA